jgi:hypothetical protein
MFHFLPYVKPLQNHITYKRFVPTLLGIHFSVLIQNASNTPRQFPVVAFIHGSAFTYSSSSSSFWGPDFIVPQGVILVAMNYRLGAPGEMIIGYVTKSNDVFYLDESCMFKEHHHSIGKFVYKKNCV